MFGRICLWSHLVLGFCLYVVNVFITYSVSFLMIGPFIWSISSWFGLMGFKSLESCPFLLGCQICWRIIVHSILFVFLQYLLRCLLFPFIFHLSSFSLLRGESGQRFVRFVYPFKELDLHFIDVFLLFFESLLLLISSLIFMISLLLLNLGFVCSSFYNSLRW